MRSTHQFTKDHRHNNVMSSMLLKVNKDSHIIKKSSSSPAATKTVPPPHHKHPHPVIIYTHSPKVIHTKPEEFRALIQTLTGYTGSENTTKNNPKSPPQPAAPPPPPLLAATKQQLPIMFYDFEEFETKNVIPLNNNNNNNLCTTDRVGLFNKIDDNTSSMIMKQEISMNSSGGRECASLPVYFPPPIFDPPAPHQTDSNSLPFLAPNFEEFCYNNNNNMGNLTSLINSDHSRSTFYNNSYSEDVSRENESDYCYYNIGTSSSSLDMCLQSSSSPSGAIDELADFS